VMCKRSFQSRTSLEVVQVDSICVPSPWTCGALHNTIELRCFTRHNVGLLRHAP